ncbi:MAG: metallophosphoesterase family protein, partial [Bacteroidota bacterium]
MRQYILAFIFCLCTAVIFCQTKPYAPSPIPDRIVLSWSEDPARTQSVTWRTDVSVKVAWGEIALADATPDFSLGKDTCYARTNLMITNNNAAHFHSATFTELEPGRLYAYRVGSELGWSEWFHFRTAKDTAAPFSFAYFGDAQNLLKSYWSRVVRQAYSTMPEMDFMFHAGDLVNVANKDEEWGEWFYAGGWITGTKPQMAVPGNHEYFRNKLGKRKLSRHWKQTFTLPKNGPAELSETVYYFDYQGVRFVALNTQAMLSYPEELVLQKEWLTEVLSTNPNRWTVVVQHHPIYSTATKRDNPEIRKQFQPIYEKYGVDLVLQGHDHTYGRGYNLAFG